VKLGLRAKLFAVSVLLVLAAVISAGLFLESELRERLEAQIENELVRHANSARAMVGIGGTLDTVEQIDDLADRMGDATQMRVTVIDESGRVLGDSELSVEQVRSVENHGDRPEVAGARSSRLGRSRRSSATLATEMLYIAVPFEHGRPGWVVRVARPLSEVDSATKRLRTQIIVACLIGLIAATALSVLVSKLMIRTLKTLAENARAIARGEPRAPIDVAGTDELGHLAGSLNQMAESIEATVSELAQERARLRRLEVVRRDFVANVSHELRTPVSVVQANAETLLDGAMDDPTHGRPMLEAVHRNAERMSSIIADLLDLSRLESGRYALAADAVPIETAATTAVEAIGRFAEDKATSISLDTPTALVARADGKALEQVLVNLLENAVKYSPEGGHVRVVALAADDAVRIEVRDDGPGIPPEHRERVFERFYRVDPGRSRDMGGTGLGLSIVKHMVEAMNGSVGVTAGAPRGSVFWIELPRAA
jgi:two-component system phosphate regulon sensor histidine kinase PhoR